MRRHNYEAYSARSILPYGALRHSMTSMKILPYILCRDPIAQSLKLSRSDVRPDTVLKQDLSMSISVLGPDSGFTSVGSRIPSLGFCDRLSTWAEILRERTRVALVFDENTTTYIGYPLRQ
jgi:hypothetical protein